MPSHSAQVAGVALAGVCGLLLILLLLLLLRQLLMLRRARGRLCGGRRGGGGSGGHLRLLRIVLRAALRCGDGAGLRFPGAAVRL